MSIKIICSSILIMLLCSNYDFLSPALARRHRHQKNEKKTGLRVGFYKRTCPQAEIIVKEAVRRAVFVNPGIAAGLLRLYFHDCFVKGCDASVLLDSTPSGDPTEKTSPGNVGLRGFEVIDEAKSLLEQYCPDTVSCADILAFAARDAVFFSGLARYWVPSGRRDGLSSLARNVFSNLPLPDSDVDQMEEIFKNKNMGLEDLVALLGAHSIGVAHCFVLDKNFYDFNETHMVNPNIDSYYAEYLRSICPPPGSPSANMEDVLPLNADVAAAEEKLSNVFYRNVLQGRAVITADQSLLADPRTSEMVSYFSWRPLEWAKVFRKAMVKLGNVEVITGDDGEIRRSCRAVNQ